jgi:hypothetical protein
MLATIGIIAVGGFRPAGILISSYCQGISGFDAAGHYYSGSWVSVGVYTNGTGGTYESPIGENTNGCYYPSGYYLTYNEFPSKISWINSQSGQSGEYTWYAAYSWTVADGAGGSTSGGTGIQFGYYGTIINSYFNSTDGRNYIVAFDPLGGGSGNPSYYEYSTTGAGQLISSQCITTSGQDAQGTYWYGSWLYEETYSDGSGGSYSTIIGNNMGGCWYPAGYKTFYQQSDLTHQWSHGIYWGYFTYGYAYGYTEADGMGVTNNLSGSSITATDGQVVHEFIESGAFGYPTRYVLYFRLSDTSLQTTSYIVAGTFLGSGCTMLYNYPDAAGNLFTVAAKQYQYADGVGGYYYTYVTNDYDCGYLPSGYYTQYTYGEAEISYNTYESIPQTFNYGNVYSYTMADGMNGYTAGTGENYYYSAGYIFYSYYDGAGLQYVNFVYDGLNGYVIEYVMA